MRWTQGPVYAGDDDDIEDRLPQRAALVVAAHREMMRRKKSVPPPPSPPFPPPRQTRACCLSLSRARALRWVHTGPRAAAARIAVPHAGVGRLAEDVRRADLR
jgi:hypothetical protein